MAAESEGQEGREEGGGLMGYYAEQEYRDKLARLSEPCHICGYTGWHDEECPDYGRE